MSVQRLKFDDFDVSYLAEPANESIATVLFAHGAGAGMHHSTLEAITDALQAQRISTARFNFPYMEAGKNRVDAQAVSTRAIAAALDQTRRHLNGPFFIGGHSFGGRMASHAAVDYELDICGLIFCSFPLHNPKKPDLKRAEHLDRVKHPMLFLSGTRDGMASETLLEQVVSKHRAELHWLDTADHGYKTLKRTRKRTDDVFTEMSSYIVPFVEKHAR